MKAGSVKTDAVKMAGSFPEDLVLVDVRSMPAMLYGFCGYDGDAPYTRIPVDFAHETNYMGGLDTAGGRIRFSTDSAYVALKVIMPFVQRFCHMTLCASSGFDLYVDQDERSTYYATFYPPLDMTDGYEAIIHFPERKTRYLTINFPLYNRVSALYLGLQQHALIGSGAPYRSGKPFVYYGSSITQGGCASRPGNAYPAIISRMLNIDHLNLGFSGRARGEQAMAEYIARLDMDAFIMDYDYNAPDEAHLSQTHESFFQIIRDRNQSLPILMISRPNFDATPQYLDPSPLAAVMRRDIVYQTYLKAVKKGDKQAYYLDGQSLFGGEGRDCCTVDATHPNDLGFWRMADMIGQSLKYILRAKEEPLERFRHRSTVRQATNDKTDEDGSVRPMKWITKGFASFMRGRCGNSGQNLYVSAAGVLQRIYQFDVNQDGYPDLLFANSQSMGERPPVYLYKAPLRSSDYISLPSNGTYDGLFHDLSGDGFDDLVLACQNDGAHNDTTAVIYFGNPGGLSEKYKMELPVPDATGVAAGDFNGDGKPDLAFLSCGQVRLFCQAEQGFHAPSYLDLPIFAQSVAAADLDQDGFTDLYAKMADGSAQVFWGGPDGLSAKRKTTVHSDTDTGSLQATSTPGRKAVDHDWRPAVISIGGQAYLFRADKDRVYLYTCDENRRMQQAFDLPCPHAVAAAAGDFDGDGQDDLAVTVCKNVDATEDSLVFWNSGGCFSSGQATAVATISAQSMTVIPSEDGTKENLVVCQGGTSVMRSTESRIVAFSQDRRPEIIARLQSGDAIRIAAGCPEGGGRVQLAVLNHETGRVRGDELVSIYLGGADGYQADRKIELPGWAAVDGLMFDANDDGLVDVLVSNCAENAPHLDPGSFLYLQNEEGFDPQRRIVLPTIRSHGCIVGDFRKSGYLDIATGGFHSRMISIYRGGPDGYDLEHPTEIVLGPDSEGYRPPAMGNNRPDADASAPSVMTSEDQECYKEFGETRWLFSADFNGDGWLDLFVSQIIGPYCYILWGGPEGFSTDRMLRLSADGVASANAADLDGDGYLDLILAGHQSIGKRPEGKYESYVTIYWGGPDGYKENRKTQLPASCANAVTVGDFNGDGVLDLYATAYHNGRCRDILSYVYYGQPGGIYSIRNRDHLFNHSGSGCVAGDFNRDGYADLAIACHKQNGDHISESFIFWGGPDGLSDARKIKLPTTGPHGMSIVDPGNIMDRSDCEFYDSEIRPVPSACQVKKISWEAIVPDHCKVTAYLRQGNSPDEVERASWSEPVACSGQDLAAYRLDQKYMQYRLALEAPCGCGTPRISSVVIEFAGA